MHIRGIFERHAYSAEVGCERDSHPTPSHDSGDWRLGSTSQIGKWFHVAKDNLNEIVLLQAQWCDSLDLPLHVRKWQASILIKHESCQVLRQG